MAYLAVLFAAISQIFLKLGIGKKSIVLFIIPINIFILFGLIMMLTSLMFSIRALSILPLREMAFITPIVYVLVPIFSYFFLKENISRRTIIGTFIIVVGMVVSKF